METTTFRKINDIEEFTKLFKIIIPVQSEFEYYINTLQQSKEYTEKVSEYLELYADLEKFVKQNGFKSVKEYKNQCLDTLKDYLISTKAYSNILSAQLPEVKLHTKTLINSVEPHQTLVSLDFKSANYSTLKTFQEPGQDELGKDWEDLCLRFNVHKCLVKSKSFRQIVFGNTNPKRLQTFQHVNTLKLVEYLKTELQFTEEEIVFISHDEVILNVESANKAYNKLFMRLKDFQKIASGIPIGMTLFSLEKIKKDIFIKTVYEFEFFQPRTGIQGFVDTSAGRYIYEEKYKTLHGVPGHKYFMYFKKQILGDTLDERDLIYYNDGELCKWVNPDNEKKKLPHYDELNAITMEQAKTEYSYVWDKLGELIPHLTSEEKRRVVDIVSSACKSCFQAESGCQCWNDD